MLKVKGAANDSTATMVNLREDTERMDRATGIVSGRPRADSLVKMQVWKLIAEFYVKW